MPIQGVLWVDYTICIPAYNEAKRIGKLLDYLKEAHEVPIVVVNDGSTDETYNEVLKREVALINHSVNLGYAVTINDALKMVDTEIVIIGDADSIPVRDAVKRIIDEFKDPDVGAVTGRHHLANPRKGIANWLNHIIYNSKHIMDSYTHALNEFWHLNGLLMAFRVSALPTKLNKETNQDAFLGQAVLDQGYKVRYVPEATSIFKAPETVRDIIRSRNRVCRGHVILGKKYDVCKHTFTEVRFPLYCSFVLKAVPKCPRGVLAFIFGVLLDSWYRFYWIIKWRYGKRGFEEYRWQQIQSTKDW
jgi:cellulose synthase/poly-beta-1,6-N-acetylglucosamine synthase-like glycosyltransferase